MFRVALTSVLARKRRLLTTGFAIVLSVAFISGTLVITTMIDSTLDSLIGSSYRGIDAVVRSADAQETRFGQPIREPIPAETLDVVRAAAGVRTAEGFLQGLPTLLDPQGQRIEDTFGPPTLAFNWVDDERLRGGALVPGGRGPETPDEAVLDLRTAEEFGFEVGGTIQAQFPGGLRTFTITGIGGLPVDGREELVTGPRALLIQRDAAHELFNKVGGYDFVAVAADDGVDAERLVETLRVLIPHEQEAVTGEAFIRENEEAISQVISLFSQPILAFGFISMFVGAFVIYNTFSIVVAQRTRELALLRAVGAGRRQVMGSVVFEAAAVGLVAAIVGVAAGWGLAIALKGVIGTQLTLPPGAPALPASAVGWAILVGIGATVVAALIPAVRATFIPPVAAIGHVAIDRSAMSKGRRIVGTALALAGVAIIVAQAQRWIDVGLAGVGAAAGAIFLAIACLGPIFAGPLARALGAGLPRWRGVAGRIGKENAGRNPKRTAITATALSIGVCLVAVVAVLAASLRGAIGTQLSNQLSGIDLVVDSGTSFGGLGPEAANFLRDRPEVAVIDPIRLSPMTILNSKAARQERESKGDTPDGVPVGELDFLVGHDAAAAFGIVPFEGLRPPIDDLARDEVMVLQSTAEANDWEPGDTMEVWFPTTGRQQWRIAATYATRLLQADYLVNLETLTANATPEFRNDQTIFVKLRDGLSPDDALRTLRPELKVVAPTAGVNTIGDFLGERLDIVDSVVNLIYVLLGLSIVIALVGVGNTISLSIHERTRELGLLRAVGMARRQLGESVTWESAIIALAGTVIGLVVGVVLAIVFVNALDEQDIRPIVAPTTIALIGALGALAGVLTAIRPARRATNVDILAAIAAE